MLSALGMELTLYDSDVDSGADQAVVSEVVRAAVRDDGSGIDSEIIWEDKVEVNRTGWLPRGGRASSGLGFRYFCPYYIQFTTHATLRVMAFFLPYISSFPSLLDIVRDFCP